MTFYHFFSLLRYHKRELTLVISLMVLESAVSLSVPWFAGQFSESILKGQKIFDLGYGQLIVIWLSLFALQALLRFLSTYRVNFIGAQVLTELSCRLYDHIQLLPVKYFNNTKKGETLALLSNDVNIISYFLSGILTGIVPAVLILTGALIMMASISITITLVVITLVPAFYIVLKLLGRGIRPISENLVQRQADSVAIASENFGTIQLVKAFTREKVESKRYKSNAYEIQKLRKKQLKVQAILSPVLQLLVSTGVLIVVVVSAMHYQSGELTMPDIITLLMYGLLFARPMSVLANLYGQAQQAVGSSQRLIKVFQVSPEPSDTAKGNYQSTPLDFSSDINFNQVSFRYEQDTPVLQGVNLTVRSNETVMILGENGSGKTSLLHLLMRFISPTEGEITLGDVPLNNVQLSLLRKKIGFVSQEITLCDGTIADNIAFGYPQASFEEIKQVAIKSGADTFITALEGGYQTKVGENGVLLSGGQKQKISLARALMSKPLILLLDEPTSMIDKKGTQVFKQNLSMLFKEQTVIMVSHDESLVELADHVYTMSHGQLIKTSLIKASHQKEN